MKIRFYILISCLVVFGFSSCDYKPAWQETEKGLKYWSPSHSGRYEWTGGTRHGVIHGEGNLEKINRKGEVKESQHYFANLGLISQSDIFKLNNGWSYWGDDDEGTPEGLGVIVRPDDQALVIGEYHHGKTKTVNAYLDNHLLYTGGWKNYAYFGDGILYSPKGNIIYKGRWKNGLYQGYGELNNQDGTLKYRGKFAKGLYNGYGILYNSDGSRTRHVWKNGELNPKYAPFYDMLDRNIENISEKEYISFKNHIVAYERYAIVWKSMIVCILLLLLIWMIRIYKTHSAKKVLFTAQDPIQKRKAYMMWLFGGLFGFHQVYLASWIGFVNIGLVIISVVLNLTPLTLFVGHYTLMPTFMGITWSFYVALGCIGFIVIKWMIDALWVAYRIYYLTNVYYRHDIRELDILDGHRTDVDRLLERIAKDLPQLIRNIQGAIADSRGISREQIKHSTMIGKALKIGEKDLKESQLNRIQCKVLKVQQYQQKIQDESRILQEYLVEARVAAYRNISLAKEVIAYFKSNVKSKEQKVHNDEFPEGSNVQLIKVTQNGNTITLDIDGALNYFDKTCVAMINAGFSGNVCVSVGGIMAIGALAISYLLERNKLIQQYTQEIYSLIDHLNDISREVVEIESQLLRINELLRALYECNKAFIFAYTKIRDRVFPTPSFWNFLKGIKLKDKYFSSDEFTQDIAFLIQVCSKYDKVNNAEIK